MNYKQDQFTIYDMHVHILTPETCPLEYWAGKFKLTPEMIQLIESIYKAFPKTALKMVEKILEDIKGDDANFNAVAERFFCEPWDAYGKWCSDSGKKSFIQRRIEPLILTVYESEYQGEYGIFNAFSAVPGGLPQCASDYVGIKVYPKISGKPTDTLLQWANDNGKPLFVHTSKGGIWNKELFETEADANAACHPVSWCPYLEQYPQLKIVFCHAGGNADFIELGLFSGSLLGSLPNNWALACFDVIDLYPDRVWVDTAYHQSVCTHPELYTRAFRRIAQNYPNNIIFGSDWPLVLMDVPSYHAYIDAFREAAGDFWEQIANINPRRVLEMME